MNETREEPDYVFNIIMACAWTVTTLLILFLNTVCLIVLSNVTEFHAVTKIFLKSMTASDLVLGLFFYLPMIGISLNDRKWPFGDFLCCAQAWFVRQALPTNAMSLLLVTIDRYIAVVYPLQYVSWLTARRATVVVSLLWFLTNLYSFVSIIISDWNAKYTLLLFVCQFPTKDNTAAFVLTLLSLGSIVIIMIMYIRIFFIAHSQAATIAAQHQPLPQNRKSFTTVFIVSVTLFIGWLPSVIMGLTRNEMGVSPHLRVSSQILLASVSWLNVMIYYVRMKAFRDAGHNVLRRIFKICCRCDPKHTNLELDIVKEKATVESTL